MPRPKQGENMSTESGATVTATPISINSGDSSPATFDELDSVESAAKSAAKSAKNETKEIVKETVKAMSKDVNGGKNKESEESVEENEESGKIKEKKDQETGKEDGKPKMETKAKIKGKYEGKDIELSGDTLFTVKINGKDEVISLSDLQSQYSGKVAYDKKFSEVDRDRKAWEGKVSKVQERINGIFNEKDPDVRMMLLAEHTGHDPVELRQKFMQDNINMLENWYGMTDAEKETDLKNFENKVLRSRLETRNAEDKHQQAIKELDTKFQEYGKTHQISKSEFSERYSDLKTFKKEGRLPADVKITPEFIAETIVKDRLWNSASEILDSSGVQLPKDIRDDALYSLVNHAHSLGLSPSIVREIAMEKWGKSSESNIISSKFDEAEEHRTGKKASFKTQTPKSSEAMFFDDL